jgi:hypothetical protein
VLLVSFLLVIVATVFLVAGLFLTKQDLTLIFISIGCSALAGLVLIAAVLRSRPRQVSTEAAGRPAETPLPATGLTEEAAPPKPMAPAPARTAEAGFPIAGYDDLEVVEILPLLGDLEPAELDMVRQREASGRAHPWILARIDALLESEADTGEVEWGAPARWAGPAAGRPRERAETEEAEEFAEADEFPEAVGAGEFEGMETAEQFDDFDEIEEVEPEPGWDRSARASEWAAADFPLDDSEVSSYEDVGVAGGFPIDRYDELKATDILPLLSELHPEDLKLVRQEEAAGKARSSILTRIDVLLARELPQTTAPSSPAGEAKAAPAKKAAKAPTKASAALPIEGYDNLTVPQITARLGSLTAAELKQLRAYEKRHKGRLGVLQKIDGALLRAPR